MATNKNKIIKIKGTLNGLSFYTLNGKEVIRKAYGPSSQTINNNPAYKTVKNNNTEFALASTLSKTIRLQLSQACKHFQDSYIAGRLTGIIRKIINNSEGEKGKRHANFKATPLLLVSFPLTKNKPFSYYCTAKYMLTFNKLHNIVNLNIKSINKNQLHKKPKTATHFKITLAIAIVAERTYNSKTKIYQSNKINVTQLINSSTSHLFNVNSSHNNISLKIIIPNNSKINKKTTITTWLGIQYYNTQNNLSEPIFKANAMSCENVF